MRIAVVLGVVVLGLAAPAWAAPPPIEEYGKLPAVDNMRVSPAGDMLAFVAADGGRQQVRISKVGGAPLINLGISGLKVRDVAWLGEGHVLVQASRADKADPGVYNQSVFEITQSTIIDVATGKSIAVFHDDPHVLPATMGYYGYAEIGGKTYGFFAGEPLSDSGSGATAFHTMSGDLQGFTNLYRVNLETGHGDKVAGGSQLYETSWLVDRSGAIVAHGEYQTKSGEWRLYADPDDTHRLMRADDPTGNISLLGLGRSADEVLLVMPPAAAGGDWRYMAYSATTAAAPEEVLADFSIGETIFSPRTGLLLGAVATDKKTVKLFDPKLQGRFDAVRRAFPGETVDLVSESDSFEQIVVRTTGPGDSGTYFFVDLTTGKAAAVGWNYPTILQDAVAEVREVNYKAADGLDIEGLLTLPPGRPAKNLPLVVMPHGGPEYIHDSPDFDWWAQAFASRGYAVFQPNFRGSGGFGKPFSDAGFGQWGRKMQTDISDGVADLAKQGLVDPKRACIVGASYGGYAALAGVTVQQGLYRCAVSVGGVGNLNDMLKWEQLRMGEQSETMRIEKQMMGVTSIGDPSVAAYSPQRLAAKADAPILLMYGHDDTVVNPQQSLDMAGALKSAGKPVELVELPDEDHWLSREPGRIAVVKASIDFVVKNNPPD